MRPCDILKVKNALVESWISAFVVVSFKYSQFISRLTTILNIVASSTSRRLLKCHPSSVLYKPFYYMVINNQHDALAALAPRIFHGI